VANLATDLKYRYPGRYLASWGALALLVAVAASAVPASLHGNSLRVVSALAGVLALASLGQMLVVMLGAIDLSVPAVIAASAGVVVHYGTGGANLGPVIAGALAVAVVISLVNGVFISVVRLNPIIVTLATFGIVSGGIVLWTGSSFSPTDQAPQALQSLGNWSVLNISACFLIAVAAAVLLSAILSRTRGGRHVAAIGSNRRAARGHGIRVTRVEMVAFAGAGLLYGIAGVLLAGFIGTPDVSVGLPYQLATITAVAIAGAAFSGGPASVASVLSACVFLELLDEALAIRGLSAGVREVAQGVALAVAVAAITLGRYGLSGWRQSRRWINPVTGGGRGPEDKSTGLQLKETR
jgi:ribose/xylose/arabinose/galactoside ABC-type transport system permease subunit